ncbi:hypothetical protein GS498_20455 [Rhodococcus hoagii]|nr:hypothetical protein [Prescottella equi]
MSGELFILYRQTGLKMGGERPYNARTRAFTVRGQAINYARKHGASIVHLVIPQDAEPYIADTIHPEAK